MIINTVNYVIRKIVNTYYRNLKRYAKFFYHLRVANKNGP